MKEMHVPHESTLAVGEQEALNVTIEDTFSPSATINGRSGNCAATA